MTESLSERAEESAEQVLARLERYVASLRARPQPSAPVHRAQVVDTEIERRMGATLVETRPAARLGDTLIPSHEAPPLRHDRFVAEVAPALVAVTACSFVILLTAWFDVSVAAVVCGVLLALGVVGLVRRTPLARPYMFGLVVAALLIRLS